MSWRGWIQCDVDTAMVLGYYGVKFGEQCSSLGNTIAWKDCDVPDDAYALMLDMPDVSWCLVHKDR